MLLPRPSARLLSRIGVLGLVAAGLAVPLLAINGERMAEHFRLAMRDFNRAVTYRLGLPLPGTPDLARLDERLAAAGVRRGAPVFLRIFKRDSELELWMQRGERFILFATYPVCYWSGGLGPKVRQGDRQAPEGFYAVGKGQLNPNSRWHRSFNLGFPNVLDRAHQRTGDFLMVHGGCSSIGCYAMTNPVIDEIWALVTAALGGGQPAFAVHVFAFRPTGPRMRFYAGHSWAEHWRAMQPAYDIFEATRVPPRVSVCGKRYAIAADRVGAVGGTVTAGCPETATR